MVVPRVTFLTRLSCKLSTFYIFNRAISFTLIFTLFLDLEYSSKIPPYQYKALSVEPNKAVTEKCGIEGFPPDNIKYVWYNPKGEVIESSRDLNQKLSQFGNYTCNATNGKLTSPPWKYVLEVKEDTGENHRLHCLHCTKSVTCHCTKVIHCTKSVPLWICSVNVTKSVLRIWSHLLKKSVMENFVFVRCIRR